MFSDVAISTDIHSKSGIPRELFPRDVVIYTQTMYIVGEGLAPPDCPSKMMDNINPCFFLYSAHNSVTATNLLTKVKGTGGSRPSPTWGSSFDLDQEKIKKLSFFVKNLLTKEKTVL